MRRVQVASDLPQPEVPVLVAAAPQMTAPFATTQPQNDMQRIGNALAVLSPVLQQMVMRHERKQQEQAFSQAQMETEQARMNGTMEPLRQAVQNGQLHAGRNPWLNEFRKRLAVSNDVDSIYRGKLQERAQLLADPDATPEAKQQAYNEARAAMAGYFSSKDPTVVQQLYEDVAQANSEFEETLTRRRAEATLHKAREQADIAMGRLFDSQTSAQGIDAESLHTQVRGFLDEARQMGVQDTSGLFVDNATVKVQELAAKDPDKALELLEAVREFEPTEGGKIGRISRYQDRLDQLEFHIHKYASDRLQQKIDGYKADLFSEIDKAVLAQPVADPKALIEAFGQRAEADGYGTLRLDIPNYVMKRIQDLHASTQFIDENAINEVKRLAFSGDFEEARTLLETAPNIPLPEKVQLNELLQDARTVVTQDDLDETEAAVADVFRGELEAGPESGDAEIARMQDKASRLRLEAVTALAKERGVPVDFIKKDAAAMAAIKQNVNTQIAAEAQTAAKRLNIQNKRTLEVRQRNEEIRQAELPSRLMALFRSEASNMRNIDNYRLRLLDEQSKETEPTEALAQRRQEAEERWHKVREAAEARLAVFAKSLTDDTLPAEIAGVSADAVQMAQDAKHQVTHAAYMELHGATGYSLGEIQNRYTRHGIVYNDAEINPQTCRIVADGEEFRQLLGNAALLGELAQRFNLPPEVLISAQADQLGIKELISQ